MTEVKVVIKKIVNMSFPIVVEFELTDISNTVHKFIDKVPIVSADYDITPPCTGYMRCNIIKETDRTFIIDTSLPDDIESLEGEYIFEVNKEQVTSFDG